MALLLSLKRTVNLEPGLTAPQVFHVSQNDVGTKLYVGLEQGGTAYTIPENTTAKVQGCNALGEPFEAITATVSTNEVYFTITDQDVTQFAGNAKCEVVLTNGTNILGTANFIVAVEASPMGSDVPAIYTNPVQAYIEGVVQDYVDDDVLPGVTTAINSKADASDVGDLTELETTDKTSLVDAINEVVSGKVAIAQGSGNAGKALVVNASGNVEPGDIAIDIDDTLTQQGEAADAKATGDALALKANESTIAPEFSESTAYTAGQYVYKNGVLYRFTADHTAGAWMGSDAEVVTVGGEVDSLVKSTASEFDMLENALFSKNEITGSAQIPVPENIAVSSADIVSLGASVSGIKTTGKNLYPHGAIALYDYGFYVSSLTSAKNRGLRLPVGVYTLTFATSEGNNRIQARAWKDDGTLLNEAGADKPIRMRYLKDDSTLNPLYWQTYRFATALPETGKKIIIEVHDFPVWFLFCEDANSGFATSVTNVQIESGYDNATTYEAYHVNEYPATASKVSVAPGGLINFTEADQTDTSCTVAFYVTSDEGNKIIANQYDTSESGYAVGDYCIYSGKLYRCTIAQETGTNFNAANWVEIVVMDEVKTLNNSFDTLSSAFNNYKAEKDENLFLRPYMQTPKPKLFAHTGYTSASAPENTIPAYIAAGEKGFYGIEADVQKTSDGHYVMMHDTTVDRMTDGSGSIANMTLAQIQALHIKDHSDLTVPTFEEFLAICRTYGMIPQIELKSTIPNTAEGISNVIQVIKDAGLYNTAILMGSYYNISAVRAADQFIPFGIIGQSGGAVSFSAIVAAAVAGKNLLVALEATGTITDQMKKDCRDNNVPLMMFTATTVAGIRNMFNAGADMVTVQGTGVYIPEPTA